MIQVDGYIARNFKGQLSHLGSVLDPLADKFLISILYVTLTVNGIIPGIAILDTVEMMYIQLSWYVSDWVHTYNRLSHYADILI